MSDDRDDRIVELLRQVAPPARDPMFRLKVLERREQRQFQRRLFTLLAGLLVILLLSIFGSDLGGGALKSMGSLVVGTAIATACVAFRGRLLHILRRFGI